MEKSEPRKRTLYVGFDDSKDLVVALFSFEKEDSLVKTFSKRRKYEELLKWYGDPYKSRDFRFVTLPHESPKIHQHIPAVIPGLVNDYLKQYRGPKIYNLNLYLDGVLKSFEKNKVRRYYQQKKHPKNVRPIENILVDNFEKRQGIHKCPSLVYYADIFANNTFRELNVSKKRASLVMNHLKRVRFGQHKLDKIIKQIKRC